jgi:hypothetical protein
VRQFEISGGSPLKFSPRIPLGIFSASVQARPAKWAPIRVGLTILFVCNQLVGHEAKQPVMALLDHKMMNAIRRTYAV